MSVKTKPLDPGAVAKPTNYNGLDLMKFICAIFVFLLHSRPFPASAEYMNFSSIVMCRLAVPFFFASSGFFLFRKMDLYNINADIVRNYCYRLLMLYGLWNVLLVFGERGALWYLSGTTVAVVMIALCFKVFKMKIRSVIVLSILLYIIAMLGNSYDFVGAPLHEVPILRNIIDFYVAVFGTTRKGMFFGFIFVFMGALIAHCKVQMTAKKAFVGFVVFLSLLYAEAFFLKLCTPMDYFEMCVMLVPAVYFLFMFMMSVNLKDRPVYRRLRTLSMIIYFIHWPLKDVVGIVLDNVRSKLGMNLTEYAFVISFVVVMGVSFFIEWLSRREKFKWINWLF